MGLVIKSVHTTGLCFTLFLCLLLHSSTAINQENLISSTSTVRNLAGNNDTFINAEFDKLLESAPEFVWDILSGVGIGFGLLVAFFGLRILWLTGFICGAIVGAFASILVLSNFEEVAGETYLIAVGAGSIGIGLLVACLVKFSRFIIGIAIAIVIVGFAVQYGLVEVIGSNIGMWILLGVCVIAAVVLIYRTFEFGIILASAFVGGVGVALGLSYYIGAGISIYSIYTDPSSVICQSDACWIAVSVGLTVTLLGVVVQISRKINKSGGGKSSKSGNSPTYDETQQFVDKRVSKVEQKQTKSMRALAAQAKKEQAQQRKELGQLKETVSLVENERRRREEAADKEKARVARLEQEMLAAREAIQSATQSAPGQARLEELARQVDTLTRLQEVNEQDKLELSERNARLQRQLEETQRITNQMVADRNRRKSFAKSQTMRREEASVAAHLASEREALQRALEAATQEQRLAKEQAALAMKQVQELKQVISLNNASPNSQEASEKLNRDLETFRRRQAQYEREYEELQEANLDLVTELGRLASETAEARVVESVDGESEKPMAIPVDLEGGRPAAPRGGGAVVSGLAQVGAVFGYIGNRIAHRRAGRDRNAAAPTGQEAGGGEEEDDASVASFNKEFDDIMEDQIGGKELVSDIGKGMVALAKGTGLVILKILKGLFDASKYVGNAALESYRERREMKKEQQDAKLRGEEWVNAFQSTA